MAQRDKTRMTVQKELLQVANAPEVLSGERPPLFL